MEKYDVAIIGGGSAGLAALKQLSTLGKQAVLLEAGEKVGTKNISGGILYSKKPNKGRVYNAEDVYGQSFVSEAPLQRKITKYLLHATSKDKVFSMDLTAAHEYQSNFGYSVLMNELNGWFGQSADESAQKCGGGIVPGVHVNDISYDDEKERTTIQTDELDEFQVKAVIAADGVNSEVAQITHARQKFSAEQLYQGVKAVVKQPEDVINDTFKIGADGGVAHLFAGDITLNHLGGGFLYTNRDTLSVGAVYHLNSLLDNPIQPHTLLDALLKNPMITELIKDEVPVKGEIDKTLEKEKQMQIRFAVTKLIKTWYEIRDVHLSSSRKKEMIKAGKFSSEDEVESKLSELREKMSSEYGITFKTDYVEDEYGAKLIPDGKRCRMKKPYHKNVLFVGDAAGRGVFVGPRIEGLNVGIDDGVRAANAVARALEKNNFSQDYLGEYYTKSVEESPYTKDMKEIDKEYLKIFIDATKDVPKNLLSAKHSMVLKLMSSGAIRSMAARFANVLGYERLLPVIESQETYVKVPTDLAELMGKTVSSSYTPSIPLIADRIAKLKYNDDKVSHIKVLNSTNDFMKKLVMLCPTGCYSEEKGQVTIQHEGCIECGTCSEQTDWKHPRGEKGINYQYG
jgi:electron transfer flavoprotein-quinone oxidoreductase